MICSTDIMGKLRRVGAGTLGPGRCYWRRVEFDIQALGY
ncbi:hypothetical protein CsSME_00032318 [Camellia sinensis var. sinensis]